MKKIILLISCIGLFTANIHLTGQTDSLKSIVFKVQEMKADLDFLLDVMKETHPGLYRYTSKTQMQAQIDKIKESFNQPMAFYDYYQKLAQLMAQIRCAHTNIWPNDDLGNFYAKYIKTFPLSIFPIKGRYYVGLNGGTAQEDIKVGDELIAINGLQMPAIREQILQHYGVDGYIQSAASRVMSDDGHFPLFYYLWVDQSETFEVEIKDNQGNLKTFKITGQTRVQNNQNILKNPVNKDILDIYLPKSQLNRKQPWRLEMQQEPGTALLTIRSFGQGNSDAGAKREIQKFLKNCAKELKANQIKNLIIDLRFNGGGWDIQGQELFRFLIQKPSLYYQKKHLLTKDSDYLRFSGASPKQIQKAQKTLQQEDDGTFTIIASTDESLQILEPYQEPYRGKVYVLMNAHTSSAAAEFTAMVQSNDLAICIGEEPGGGYEGGNSGIFLNFTLPNSKIQAQVPLVYYDNAVKAPKQNGRGTLPDYPVQRSFEDFFNGVDTELEFVLDLIRGKQ